MHDDNIGPTLAAKKTVISTPDTKDFSHLSWAVKAYSESHRNHWLSKTKFVKGSEILSKDIKSEETGTRNFARTSR